MEDSAATSVRKEIPDQKILVENPSDEIIAVS